MEEGGDQGRSHPDSRLRSAGRMSIAGLAYPAAISLVARIGSFKTLHRADRFASRGAATACLPKIYTGHADAGVLGHLSDAKTTLQA